MVRAPPSSTGCEVMRPSRLHAKDGLTLRIQTQKEMRNAKMNERRKDRKDRRGSQERARARSRVTVYSAAGASRSLRSLLRCASPRFAGDTPAAGANE
jgi:hypothetical protein